MTHEMVMNTSKANQRIARAAAEFAYSGNKWNVCRTLDEAYGRYSTAKARAYEYCRRLYDEMGGFDFVISSHNCMVFSVCFKFIDDETGVLCYAYITRDYDRFCEA